MLNLRHLLKRQKQESVHQEVHEIADGVDQLKKHEGLRLKPYRCTSDRLTIGYGRNLDANGITEGEAEYLLRNDIKSCIRDARTFKWFNDLNESRKWVIVNLIFNMGLKRFSQFKKTISLIEEEKYIEASKEMLKSRWAKQVGFRAEELSMQMEIGQFVNTGR